jgi:hypothetical protein
MNGAGPHPPYEERTTVWTTVLPKNAFGLKMNWTTD